MPAAKKTKNSGFTLVETLTIAAVMAILFIPTSIFASGQIKKAHDGKRKAELNRIKTGLYDYYFDQDCFPTSLPACNENLKEEETVYQNNFPCDPKGNSYVYETEEKSCPQWFKVLTNLENTQDKDIDRIGCRMGCGPNCQYNYGIASSNISVYEGCVKYFACNPGGQCQQYDNPGESGCPATYKNDPDCKNFCTQSKKQERCKNASGKQEPGSNEPNNPEKGKK